ncbi:MAG TPA: AIR synthase family protein [Anaerolineae bacterium]|nr:AIR synthase family protein [Anaerolineae bacterium]
MTDSEILGVGKLPLEFLQQILARYGGQDNRVVVGPRVGEDAAVLDMGDRYLVVKSDPITFASDEIGRYVVHVNANDLATMGAQPRWMLLTLLLPEGETNRALVEAIMAQVAGACQPLGIALCGGHTEITYGLDRPIAVGSMLGEVEKDALVQTAGALVGDDIVLTKGIAIEGTAVLAREAADRIAAQVGTDVLDRARRLLSEPGISVVRDAQIVQRVGRPHAMHDPTEGGLATGLWELALASGKGIVVDMAHVPLFPETQVLCCALGLDALGLIASGALLIAAAPEESGRMVHSLQEAGIRASVIGRVVDGPAEVRVTSPSGPQPLRMFERDELARVFSGSVS